MKTISVIDTSISSYNLGNQIIMDSIRGVMEELFPDDFLYYLPPEGPTSKAALNYMRQSDNVIFGGTNSLSSNMLKYKQMGFGIRDLIVFNKLTLLGVGWWQYQDRPDLYTRAFINRLLSNRSVHSVRDEYTKKMLHSIGVNNVINTCCPTTWKLTEGHCAFIPTKKAKNVILTLTDYNKSRETDERLLDILFDSYNDVLYWIQGVGDLIYAQSFQKHVGRLKFIPPKLRKYDEYLESEDCDYIGTRLHAGIRAIQKQRRTLILSVDNRATEIANDVKLNAISRSNFLGIQNFINDNYETRLKIPFDQISLWKSQYLNL